MKDHILLVLTLESGNAFIETALDQACALKKGVVAIQILTSHLYHYGHNDILAGGRSKTAFLLHIRQEVLEKGRAQSALLSQRAAARGIPFHFLAVETEDPAAAVVAEAQKGYDLVIVPKEPRRLFPLLHRTLKEEVRRKAQCQVVEL